MATSKADLDFLEQFEPDLFWEKHGRKVIWGLVAVLAIGTLIVYSQRQAAERQEIASQNLSRATDPAALQKFALDYKGSELGAQALLKLSDLHAQAGRLNDALAGYQQFVSLYPKHPLLDTAQLGLAEMLESQGNFEDAKKQYLLLAARPNSYTVNAAKLGAARCAEMLGQTKEAAQYYEELMAVAAHSPWELEVAVRLGVLSRTMQPAEKAVPAKGTEPILIVPPTPAAAAK